MIVRRLAKVCGLTTTLEATGQSFDEIAATRLTEAAARGGRLMRDEMTSPMGLRGRLRPASEAHAVQARSERQSAGAEAEVERAAISLSKPELDKLITVKEDGQPKRITKREGIVTQLVNRGIKGDPKSLQLLIAHLEKHREVEPFTPTEADDAALLAALSAPDNKEDDHGDR